MIDPDNQAQLKEAVAECVGDDRGVLEALREEVRPLRSTMRRIQSRTTTAISFMSLVATGGSNEEIRFDPFLIQMIRVVDSSNYEHCLEVISPTTSIQKLNQHQFYTDGSARTALGEMMLFLGVDSLTALSPMIPTPGKKGRPVSSSWVQVYRELVEWAILFAILKKDFSSDTLILRDGLLRSKVFATHLFPKLLAGIEDRINAQWRKCRCRVYLASVAKHSKVLSRYRLAMTLEGILQTDYPAYVEVAREVEEQAYIWSEFAYGNDYVREGREVNNFVGGKMFLVKFGSHRRDPVWPIDIFVPQTKEAQIILGAMLGDAINGFPMPYYPRCLQKAHENAALADFDFAILQDYIYAGVRASLGDEAGALDAFQLQNADPSRRG